VPALADYRRGGGETVPLMVGVRRDQQREAVDGRTKS
jgi:hypothetical protein